jgi:Rrf2 family protein
VNHFSVAVEYALHVVLQLAMLAPDKSPSAKELAEFLGVPSTYLAKIMTKLDKAGLVAASEGKGGGYRLARPAQEITFLDVADAIEGRKSLFECTEVRLRCVLYGGKPPKPTGLCGIHAVMLAAETRMREQLAATTVAGVLGPLQGKAPVSMSAAARKWFEDRAAKPAGRSRARQP